jgi:hypothetical protein
MPDIAGPPNRTTSTCPLRRLTPAELATRKGYIQQFIASAQTTYPFATRNLGWWINYAGARRDVPLSEFDFSNAACGLPQFLLDKHRPVIALGSNANTISGIKGVPAGALGLEGRLRLPPSDPNSLQPGRNQTLDWEDSLRAKIVQGAPAAALCSDFWGNTYPGTGPFHRVRWIHRTFTCYSSSAATSGAETVD